MNKDILVSVHEKNNDFKIQYLIDSTKPKLIDYYNNQNYYIVQPIDNTYYEIYIEFFVYQDCAVDLVYINGNKKKIQQTRPFTYGVQQFHIKTIEKDKIENEILYLNNLSLEPYEFSGRLGKYLLNFRNYKIKE